MQAAAFGAAWTETTPSASRERARQRRRRVDHGEGRGQPCAAGRRGPPGVSPSRGPSARRARAGRPARVATDRASVVLSLGSSPVFRAGAAPPVGCRSGRVQRRHLWPWWLTLRATTRPRRPPMLPDVGVRPHTDGHRRRPAPQRRRGVRRPCDAGRMTNPPRATASGGGPRHPTNAWGLVSQRRAFCSLSHRNAGIRSGRSVVRLVADLLHRAVVSADGRRASRAASAQRRSGPLRRRWACSGHVGARRAGRRPSIRACGWARAASRASASMTRWTELSPSSRRSATASSSLSSRNQDRHERNHEFAPNVAACK